MSEEGAKPRELSPHDRDKAQAYADLEAISALRRSPHFTGYFLRRLREKIEPVEHALLREELSFEVTRAKQARLTALREILDLLEQDEIGNRSTVTP